MKKYKHRLLSLLALGVITISCQDNFSEFERDFIIDEDQVINTVNDVNRLLIGTYNALTFTNIFNFNSIGADETAIGDGNRGQGLQTFDFIISSGDGLPTGLWNSSYNTIDNANRVLESLDIVNIEEGEEDLVNSIRGQALAIRALTYFDLLRSFASNFNPNTPGVIIQNTTLGFPADTGTPLPRASVGEVLAVIDADLDAAESLIPASLNSDFEFFNLNAVAALRARIALYTEDYTSAITFATQVLNAVPIIGAEDYFNMFRDNIDPNTNAPSETIFQLEREVTDARIGNIWQANNLDTFFVMSSALENLLPDNDIRRELNLDFETDITSSSVADDNENVIGKYLGVDNATRFLTHVRVFRSSEMLLIRAEANARLGNLAIAQTDIETLRGNRSIDSNDDDIVDDLITPDYVDTATALNDILRERSVELIFEGHRLFDLKRFGLPITRAAADVNISPGIEANSFRFTLPIPQSEIFANDGITDADQNPGY